MNSSTSVSEAATGWRRFVVLSLGTIAAIFVLLVAVAWAIDPLDTGFGLVRYNGAFAKGPRLNRVSRIHDESFDAAIIGNSHVLSLSPQRLSGLSGLRFVTLGIPATGVPEQMQVLDAYLTRHSPPHALIVAVDATYCLDDPRANPPYPFPDWLYTDRMSYAMGLARLSTFEFIGRRLALIGGFLPPQPQDGAFSVFDQPLDRVRDAQRLASAAPEDWSNPPQTKRPGLADLKARLDILPAQTRVVLLLPPVYAAIIPAPGTPAAAALAACKDAIGRLPQVHPKTAIVDWHRVRPGTDVPGNFYDADHYYDDLAAAVEREIATALQQL